jgi:uncharacterized protein
MELVFEWDEEKVKENLKKHKVSFEEARTAFNDPFLLTFPDLDLSESEYRYLSVGRSSRGRVLIISHTGRGMDNIRIINCRKATASERRVYEQEDF